MSIRAAVWADLQKEFGREVADKEVECVVVSGEEEFTLKVSSKLSFIDLLNQEVGPEGNKQKLFTQISPKIIRDKKTKNYNVAAIRDVTATPFVRDAGLPIAENCRIEYLTLESDEGLEVFLHSSAHVLGSVMETMYEAKLTHGPALEKSKHMQAGFFYDARIEGKTVSSSEESLQSIADACLKFAQNPVEKRGNVGHAFERLDVPKIRALELFKENNLKCELISEKVAEGETCSIYKCGDFVDFCRGPHLPNTNLIGAFHIESASQAYFKGDQKNVSLQRVYGMTKPTEKDLKAWLKKKADAEKNDHRLIGRTQGLFFFHEYSPGSAFFTKLGAHIYNKMEELMKSECFLRGYDIVKTPLMYNVDLWKTSGHWAHYQEDMFSLDVDQTQFALKPMNCPAHCLMFRHESRSYRQLPLRFADFGTLHRNEASGALSGLSRVRMFHQDDGHIYCTPDQIEDEIFRVLSFVRYLYDDVFGIPYQFHFSTRPAKAMGSVETWEMAETKLRAALDKACGKGNYKIAEGDGAFYGPKIDIKTIDVLDREVQCATVQLDFQLPERFDLRYKTPELGTKKREDMENKADGLREGEARPVMIHRAICGSIERMMSMLIEKYKGAWPLWLSPRQVVMLPCPAVYGDSDEDISAALVELSKVDGFKYAGKTIADLSAEDRAEVRRMETDRRQAVVEAATASLKETMLRHRVMYSVDESVNPLMGRLRAVAKDRFNYVLVYGYDELKDYAESGKISFMVRRRGAKKASKGDLLTLDEFFAEFDERVRTFDKSDVDM
ncbi:Threonine-tRNA ligase class IIa [Carpediemonas membranifera]|uniref:Probable threonine--tRNA ligase, cytoplasmic n=1 Tax=Carpediemonas membranifera TaxID=201153 RepID=A0A8J6AVB9_9EUKA|nr:Threonine-tRNA ligase class IIa [Carpediemonas membranifera]|eukprot:KAG9395113.1 Threonine-tRNA ligase class IIa [Carpediemonas membranifera]